MSGTAMDMIPNVDIKIRHFNTRIVKPRRHHSTESYIKYTTRRISDGSFPAWMSFLNSIKKKANAN